MITSSLNFGIKALDNLIANNPLQTQVAESHAQKVALISGRSRDELFRKLPYCMQQIVLNTDVKEHLVVHQFVLPYKNNERFACFLFDRQGVLLEQVCYQRNFKYVKAFNLLMKTLRSVVKHQGQQEAA